jgi:2-C-methyl-D-erythritol 2,4-cyclodiphosphate synthase
MTFVEQALKLAVDNGYAITSVDVTVVCERPKLSQHRDDIERALSVACQAPVNVKAKRAEGLGAIGRVEGIAVFAVAMALRHDPPVNW